jgi:replicative DNA helicase
MGADPGVADAIYLLNRIERLGLVEVSERDLLRGAQRFKNKSQLTPALSRLVDHGYLIPLKAPKSVGVHYTSQTYMTQLTSMTAARDGQAA